jgi:hypothetical protein
MALKGQPISLGTSDTTVYTCPISTEASVHGLVIGNNTGSAATFTLKVYIQSTATTTTVATGISVAANSTYTWPKPIDVNAGDIIKIAASSLSTLVALYSVYEGSNPPVAVGFTPRGTWSSASNYVTNDVVTRSGSSYLALQASTNEDPTTATSYWMELFQDTGDVTGAASSTDNAIARFDGSTGKVIQNSAATVADTTGDITAGKYNGLTVSTTTGTLTIANGKTLAVDNSLTFTGTDSSTVSLGAGGTVAYTSNKLSAFSSTTSSELAGVISDETGTGSLVFANSPSFTTPTLGVASATSVNKVAITAPATSATLTLADGSTLITSGAHSTTLTTSGTTALTLPTSGTVTALGNSVTGSGNIVLDTSPSLTTPTLGVASATTINKVTLTAPATGSTLTIADGKTATVNNTLTLAGTDSTTMTFPASSTTVAGLAIQQAYTKQQYFSVATLTDGASISWDVSTSQKAKVTLGGARTMAAVSNPVEGATYYLYVFQDGTGGRTLAYTTTASTTGTFDFGGATTPVITTTASKGDILAFEGVNIGGYVRLRYLGIMQGFAS